MSKFFFFSNAVIVPIATLNSPAALPNRGIFLPSACGGKASCGQCKVQVLEGGGEILDSEKPHFSRKEIISFDGENIGQEELEFL